MTPDDYKRAEELLRDADSEDNERFASWYGRDLLDTAKAGAEALREMVALIEQVAPEYAESPVVANARALAQPEPLTVPETPRHADEIAYWFEVVRDWSGSAFLAGEKVEDEAALKSALYGDLCRLGNHLMAWADDAKAGTTEPVDPPRDAPLPSPETPESGDGEKTWLIPLAVWLAAERVRVDAANTMRHDTTSDLTPRLMCRVGVSDIGLVLAWLDQHRTTEAKDA